MAEGGIARRLVNFAYLFVGFIRGGLSLVNIVASTFLARFPARRSPIRHPSAA
jgi:TRAP-type C4-dicarboxylate transport system permease large subunit